MLAPVARLAANGYRLGEPRKDRVGFQNAPPPKDVPKWIDNKIDFVRQHFDGFIQDGTYYITNRALDTTMNTDAVEKVNVLATTALAAYRILRMAPTTEVDTDLTPEGAYEKRYKQVAGGRWLGYDPEDWYRCVILYSYFNQRRKGLSSILNENGPNKTVVPVPYRDPRFNPAISTTVGDAQTRKSVANMTLRQQFANFRAAHPPRLRTEQALDPQSITQAARRMNTLSMRTGLVEKMAGSGPDLAAHLEHKDKTAALPPLTMDLLDATLRELAQGIHVVDTPLGSRVVQTLVDEDTMREFVAQAGTIAASVAIAGGENQHEQEQREKVIRESFAKQAAVGTMGDCDGELAAACHAAGFEDWKKLCPDPRNPEFELRPHQLVDAMWMLNKELGLMRSSLLANDVGTGKTFVYLMLVLLAARRQESEAAKPGSPKPTYRPTLLVVPNNIVSQVHDEAVRFLGNELAIKVYYESRNSVTDSARRNNTVDQGKPGTADRNPKFGAMMDRLAGATEEPLVSSNSSAPRATYISCSGGWEATR